MAGSVAGHDDTDLICQGQNPKYPLK